MKLAPALVAAALLLAGCSGSDDAPAPEATTATPADAARSLDRDTLEKQAKEQAEQRVAADDELSRKVREEAERLSPTVSIVIRDGKVTPQGDRVEVSVGQRIRLGISSDADEEIHVHSDPEHTYEVGAGDSISKTFTIDTPGQVAIEAHHLGVTIVQLVVRP